MSFPVIKRQRTSGNTIAAGDLSNLVGRPLEEGRQQTHFSILPENFIQRISGLESRIAKSQIVNPEADVACMHPQRSKEANGVQISRNKEKHLNIKKKHNHSFPQHYKIGPGNFLGNSGVRLCALPLQGDTSSVPGWGTTSTMLCCA